MPFYASPFQVKHGSTVLVEFDENLLSWPKLGGGQLVSSVDRINTPGKKAFLRKNEFNSYELAFVRSYTTPWLAIKAQMQYPASVPRTRDTVTFTAEDGSFFQLSDAVIPTWPELRVEGCLLYVTITITGGVLT